jgi:hypothetical protein
MRNPFQAVGKMLNFMLGGLYLEGLVGDNAGRATWKACSVTWNLAINSEFALGPRKTTENVRWLAGRGSFWIRITYFCLASSSEFECTKPNDSAYMCSCLVSNTHKFSSRLFLYFIRAMSSNFFQMTFKFISYHLENIRHVQYNALPVILFREVIAVYCENYMERANKFCMKNAEFLGEV